MKKSDIKQSKILHFGVGNFHRSHQQVYTQEAMYKASDYIWGIVGVGIMQADKKLHESLKRNNYTYTLMTKSDNSINVTRIESLTDYIYAYKDYKEIFLRAIDDELSIISMTVTEGGYYIDKNTGELDITNQKIDYDLQNPSTPITILGYLSECLRQRRLTQKNGVTLLSCDNIQHNGDVLRNSLLSFLTKQDIETAQWVKEYCKFPNSMVDRITPKTTQRDIEYLNKNYHKNDPALVVCEPFTQWVIEDEFVAGRPKWEVAGAQFVKDVAPYEKIKLRLLNASHQALAYLGVLYGYRYVHEAARDRLFQQFLYYYMTYEVQPTLSVVSGVDFELYKKTVIARFSNTQVADSLARICEYTSDRIPTFNMPIIWENLHDNTLNYKASALILASWAIYLQGESEFKVSHNIVDQRKLMMLDLAEQAKKSPEYFLSNRELFGNVIENKGFVESFIYNYQSLLSDGVKKTLAKNYSNIVLDA
ncbi:mannitol dehydrogenase family protein [Thiotrichales bacterium 19S3-7]|nr:mannitol dehydrogenase family protein [Thiotrichales bacterium 19S3-7]MCF6802585.1 mannitol dehydrogenase family protein [Thiotrichales bacterium 19S3-11]